MLINPQFSKSAREGRMGSIIMLLKLDIFNSWNLSLYINNNSLFLLSMTDFRRLSSNVWCVDAYTFNTLTSGNGKIQRLPMSVVWHSKGQHACRVLERWRVILIKFLFPPILNTGLFKTLHFPLRCFACKVQWHFLSLCTHSIFKYWECLMTYYSSRTLNPPQHLLQGRLFLLCGTMVPLHCGWLNLPPQWWALRKYGQIEGLPHQGSPEMFFLAHLLHSGTASSWQDCRLGPAFYAAV